VLPIEGGGSEEAPRTLAAGALERIAVNAPVPIRFYTGEQWLENLLEPGRAYLFREEDGGALGLYLGSHQQAGVEDLGPFVPTPWPVVDRMLAMAKVGAEDVVFDLGCGDGRIVIQAAKRHGAHGVGIDLDERLVVLARSRAAEAGVADRVEFRAQDATKADFSSATVVTLYLLPESNALLRPLLDEQLRPGARIVAHDYTVDGWRHRLVDSQRVPAADGKDHVLYLYVR
jgi:SAM-dependent methyltransferase